MTANIRLRAPGHGLRHVLYGGAAALVAVAIVFFASATAYGADGKGKFSAKGVGITSCSKLLEAFAERSGQRAAFVSWMYGYFTAFNRLESRTYDVIPWQSPRVLTLMLQSYCRANPKRPFVIAVSRLAQALKSSRVRSKSDRIEAKSAQGSVRIYRETLRQVQRALARLGFYADGIDGRFGPNTRLGLEAYQQQQKLTITGIPDQRTLFRLLPIAKKP